MKLRAAAGAREQESAAAAAAPASLPTWLYVFLAVAGVVLLIAPSSPAIYVVAGVLWVLFGASYMSVPERTLLLYIVLAPVSARMPDGASLIPGLNFDTLVIFALAIAVGQVRRSGGEPQHNPLFAPVVYMAVVLAFSAVFSYASGRASAFSLTSGWTQLDAFTIFKSIKSIILFQFLGPIAFRLLRTTEQVRTAVYLIAGATLFIAADAILDVQARAVGGGLGSSIRAMNFWVNQPNMLGGFLALMLVMLTSIVLGGGIRGRVRLFLLSTVAATGVGLVFTFSRGAWLAAFAGLGYLGLARGLRTGVALVALASVGAFFIPQSAFDRMNNTFRERTNAFASEETLDFPVQVRLNQWKDLPRVWSLAPVLGHGFKTFQRVSRATSEGQKKFAAHSSIISITAEQGLVGLVGYCWIIWVFARSARALKRTTSDPLLESLAAGLIGAVCCLLLLDSAGQKFFDLRVMAYLWILAGAIARFSELERPAPASERPSRGLRLGRPPAPARATATPSGA